jgi:hypothetical protein
MYFTIFLGIFDFFRSLFSRAVKEQNECGYEKALGLTQQEPRIRQLK